LKGIRLAVAAACLCGLALAQPLPTSAPYVLEHTEVLDLRAAELKRDYQLFVSLPRSYASSTRRYPVVFVTDAGYEFPLVRSIAHLVTGHSKDMEEFILVGLSYAKGDSGAFSRRRDYTPTRLPASAFTSDMPGREPQSGEAEAYRRFIAGEVFPLVAARYRADMKRKVFAGESYGSLFGAHVLLTRPDMFEHYILGSPSLWYDKHVMFTRELAYAASHKDLKANVFLGVGALETPTANGAGSDDEDMVGDLKKFEAALRSRHYPGLHLQSKVFADEDHLTVFPGIVTRGLKWALPGKR
jgi:predicted alpha/beta superfamily hydrolase